MEQEDADGANSNSDYSDAEDSNESPKYMTWEAFAGHLQELRLEIDTNASDICMDLVGRRFAFLWANFGWTVGLVTEKVSKAADKRKGFNYIARHENCSASTLHLLGDHQPYGYGNSATPGTWCLLKDAASG